MAKWFSAALNAAKLLQPKGNKEQMLNTLRKQPGVKKEEVDFLRLDELFNGQDVITAEQLQKAIKQRLEGSGLTELTPEARAELFSRKRPNNFESMGWDEKYVPGLRTERFDARNSKYPEYSLVHEDTPRPTTPQGMLIVDELDISQPGGARKVHAQHDYVERVPQAGTSRDAYDYDLSGQHFPNDTATINNDNPRINIGHTRGFTGDLVHPKQVTALDPDGFPIETPNRRDPIFVLDEVQSDLMQGIHRQKREAQETKRVLADMNIAPSTKKSSIDQYDLEIAERDAQRSNLPYQKSWPELLLKDALQEAVDRDAPYFGWLSGERQAARYGEDQQLAALFPSREDGLKAFYDNRLVNSKLWKELGLGRPQRGIVSTKGDKWYDIAAADGEGWENSWFVKLPPEVRKRIKEQGLPLFSLGALATFGPYQNQGALYE